MTNSSFLRYSTLALGLLAAARTAQANPLAIHGALSLTGSYSEDKNYLGHTKDSPKLNLSEVILNTSKRFDNGVNAAAQLYAYKVDDYSALDLDFATVSYSFCNEFGIRAGRVKIPFGLYGETQDIDILRPYAYLPMGMYPKLLRPLTSAMDGVQLYGMANTEKLGSFEYKVAGGYTKPIDDKSPYFVQFAEQSPMTVSEVKSSSLLSGEVIWNTPVEGWRLLSSYIRVYSLGLRGPTRSAADTLLCTSDLRLYPLVVGSTAWNAYLTGKPMSTDIDITRMSFSSDYTVGNWTLGAEYSFMLTRYDMQFPLILPALKMTKTSDTFSAYLGYQATKKLQLGTYYSCNYADRSDREGKKLKSVSRSMGHLNDLDFSASYALTDWWVIKGEVHFMNGTRELSAALNGDAAKWTPGWTYYAIKTTISF